MKWNDIDTAPKDGTAVLLARNNGCGWDYVVAWWVGGNVTYPWQSEHTCYPADRYDYWQAIRSPYPA